jgi:hypothetical protein
MFFGSNTSSAAGHTLLAHASINTGTATGTLVSTNPINTTGATAIVVGYGYFSSSGNRSVIILDSNNTAGGIRYARYNSGGTIPAGTGTCDVAFNGTGSGAAGTIEVTGGAIAVNTPITLSSAGSYTSTSISATLSNGSLTGCSGTIFISAVTSSFAFGTPNYGTTTSEAHVGMVGTLSPGSLGSGYTVSVKSGSAFYPVVNVEAWTGSFTAFDVVNGNAAGGTNTTIQPGSVTPANPSTEICFTEFVTDSNGAVSLSINSSFATPIDQSLGVSTVNIGAAFSYLTPTSSTENPTWTTATGSQLASALWCAY